MDTKLLSEFLAWLVLSGGAGIAVYALWEQLEKWIPKLGTLPADIESYITLALTGVFAVLAYLAQCGLGYVAVPVNTVGWIEAIFAVFGLAVGITKVLHNFKLHNRR